MFEDTCEGLVETGWFWLSSRYYSPELCRFISPDDIEYLDPESINGLNLYCYCLNDPINNIDPTGHFVITTAVIWTAIGIGAAIGAGLGLVASVAKDLENGKLFDGDVSFLSYLGNFVGGGIAGAGIGLCSVLGAELGAAIASKTSLIVGAKIVGGVAVGGAKISGLAALGYTARTLISDSETFELSDMFTEAGANMLSGMTTFDGSVIGGLIGINVPGKFSFENFALNQMFMGLSGFYLLKYTLSLLKKKLQEIY